MDKKGYIDALGSDGRDWIDEYFESNYCGDEEFGDVFPDMELAITGNDNGSYWCSTVSAKEAIADAMWDDEVVDAVRELGYDGIPTDKGPEVVDVIIRVALMKEVYSELEDYFEENKPTIENVISQMEDYVRGAGVDAGLVNKWKGMLETVESMM